MKIAAAAAAGAVLRAGRGGPGHDDADGPKACASMERGTGTHQQAGRVRMDQEGQGRGYKRCRLPRRLRGQRARRVRVSAKNGKHGASRRRGKLQADTDVDYLMWRTARWLEMGRANTADAAMFFSRLRLMARWRAMDMGRSKFSAAGRKSGDSSCPGVPQIADCLSAAAAQPSRAVRAPR